MATYYVKNDGSDSLDGLSDANAWKTVAKVNAATFSPGDTILFNRGHSWRETLVPPSSGTDGNPITYAAYGTGNKPVISGLSAVTGWTSIGSNQWTATVSEDPLLVIIDGDYGIEQASQGAVNAADEWYWASNTLTVYATADPDTAMTIEYPSENKACNFAQDWNNFEDIRFQGARDYLFFVNNAASDCIWSRCEFYWGHEYGFLTASQYQQSNFTHSYCYSQENGCRGLQYNRLNDGHLIDNWHSYRDACSPRTSGENGFGGGIKLSADYVTDTCENIVIKNSLVDYCGVRRDGTKVDTSKGFGFWSDTLKSTAANRNTWRNNVARNCAVAGFFCEKTTYSLWHHNLGHDNYMYGLIVGAPFDPAADSKPSDNNDFYHFTLVGNGSGTVHESNLYVRGGYNPAGASCINDNTFYNFICEDSAGPHEAAILDGGENDGTVGSGNVYEYLAFGAQYAGFVDWGFSTKDTYAEFETAYGSDLHEVTSAITLESDYTLPVGSPAIDAGIAIAGINDDYRAAAPDLGAYEAADVTYSFTPETYTQPINVETGGHGPGYSLWRHYSGVIPTPYVVIITGGVANASPGTVSPSVHDIKGNAEVPNAETAYTGADAGSGDAGLAVFTGGRTYTVTAREKTILETAGYSMDA